MGRARAFLIVALAQFNYGALFILRDLHANFSNPHVDNTPTLAAY